MAKIDLWNACMRFCIEWADKEIWKIKGKMKSWWQQSWSAFANSLIRKVWTIFSVAKVFDFWKDFVVWSAKLNDDLRLNRISFETMLWSAKEADFFLNKLADFASKTPFELTGIRKQAWSLLAVWFWADEAVDTLGILGDITAGTNWELWRLVLNLWQVKTQGKLTGRELRDFAINRVPLLELLAESLGKTTQEITDLVSDGEISYDQTIQALRNSTTEWWRFFWLMERQSSETFKGISSNIQDVSDQIKEDIGWWFNDIAIWWGKRVLAVLDQMNEKMRGNRRVIDFMNTAIDEQAWRFWAIRRELWLIQWELKENQDELARIWQEQQIAVFDAVFGEWDISALSPNLEAINAQIEEIKKEQWSLEWFLWDFGELDENQTFSLEIIKWQAQALATEVREWLITAEEAQIQAQWLKDQYDGIIAWNTEIIDGILDQWQLTRVLANEWKTSMDIARVNVWWLAQDIISLASLVASITPLTIWVGTVWSIAIPTAQAPQWTWWWNTYNNITTNNNISTWWTSWWYSPL